MAAPGARVLVLGSLPGEVSLAAREYYAQPQNTFWRIMGELVGAGRELPYELRLSTLAGAGIALWDVCAAAERPGSADAAIRRDSVRANDIAALLRAHPAIGRICFNGATAAALFDTHILPHLGPAEAALRRIRLPSTSAAFAAMPSERKLDAWRAALGDVITVR